MSYTSSLSLVGSPKFESKPILTENVKDPKKTGNSITKVVKQVFGVAYLGLILIEIALAYDVYKISGRSFVTAFGTTYISTTIVFGTACIVADIAKARLQALLPYSAILMLGLRRAAAAA